MLHKVPFIGRGGRDVGTLLFDQWIPDEDAVALCLDHDGMTVSITVGKDCVSSFNEVTDELISKWLNVNVTAVKIRVVVHDVADDLAAFAQAKEQWPRGEDILHSPDPAIRNLALQYSEVGQRVLLAVIRATNRLASWASAEHGHYWLGTRDESAGRMMSDNTGFNARAVWNDGKSFRWCPPGNDDPIQITVGGGFELSRSDWAAAGDFVRSDRQSDSIGEIMANAAVHLHSGSARAAVIESVSALELAVHRFADTPELSVLRADRLFVSDTLKNDLKHLGFTNGVRHLLPVVLPPSLVDESILHRANDAIMCRHRIVHGQQRKLDLATARRHVAAARALAGILQTATRRSAS